MIVFLYFVSLILISLLASPELRGDLCKADLVKEADALCGNFSEFSG